jgi:hypothetical protein
MARIPRQTLVPGLGFALVLGLALAVTLGAARRPETRLREAVRAYATALAAGDAATAARHRADLDPAPEARRAQALRGVHWAIREIRLAPGGAEARVTVLWVGRGGAQQAEHEAWARQDGGRWAFVALVR